MTSKIAKMVCLSLILFFSLSGCETFPTPTESLLTVTPEPTVVIEPTETPIQHGCSNKNLTLEECTNSGTHEYLVEGKITAEDNLSCWLGNKQKTSKEVTSISINFIENGIVNLQFDEYNQSFHKISLNSYSYETNTENDFSTVTWNLVFKFNGFTAEVVNVCNGQECGCVLEFSYTIINGDLSSQYNAESRIRYIMADIQLGNVLEYYRANITDEETAEAVRRWDAGIRVTNINDFERKLVNEQWQVVYAGTETTINGLDVILSTDN